MATILSPQNIVFGELLGMNLLGNVSLVSVTRVTLYLV